MKSGRADSTFGVSIEWQTTVSPEYARFPEIVHEGLLTW